MKHPTHTHTHNSTPCRLEGGKLFFFLFLEYFLFESNIISKKKKKKKKNGFNMVELSIAASCDVIQLFG